MNRLGSISESPSSPANVTGRTKTVFKVGSHKTRLIAGSYAATDYHYPLPSYLLRVLQIGPYDDRDRAVRRTGYRRPLSSN